MIDYILVPKTKKVPSFGIFVQPNHGLIPQQGSPKEGKIKITLAHWSPGDRVSLARRHQACPQRDPLLSWSSFWTKKMFLVYRGTVRASWLIFCLAFHTWMLSSRGLFRFVFTSLGQYHSQCGSVASGKFYSEADGRPWLLCLEGEDPREAGSKHPSCTVFLSKLFLSIDFCLLLSFGFHFIFHRVRHTHLYVQLKDFVPLYTPSNYHPDQDTE